MEPRFKVKYIINKDYIKSLSLYLHFLRPFRIVCNVIFLLYLIQAFYWLIVFNYVSKFIFVFVPLFWVYEVFAYFRSISLTMQRYKEMNNENCLVSYEFYEDYIRFVSSNGSEYTVQYSSIKNLVKTKKLILLTSKAKVAYWFPKESFEVGDLDGFKSFMRSKDIKIKY